MGNYWYYVPDNEKKKDKHEEKIIECIECKKELNISFFARKYENKKYKYWCSLECYRKRFNQV